MKIRHTQNRVRLLATLLAITLLHNLAKADTASDYRTLWNTAHATYEKLLGYTSQKVNITASQLSSNASDVQEGKNIGALVDGDPNTFWHSDWHNQVTETHYVQIDLQQSIQGDIAFHILRRQTASHHATKMRCDASTDGKTWKEIGTFNVENPTSGSPADTEPLSLGNTKYKSLRLYILETSGFSIFSHFAEIELLKVQVTGNDRRSEYESAALLQKELEEGRYCKDWEITSDMLWSLGYIYDYLLSEMGSGELDTELIEQFRQLLAEARDAYETASGCRMGAEIPLRADQLSSNASDYVEGKNLGAMLDGNPSTYWHSDWHGQVTDTHYIEIALAEPVSGAVALYVQRRLTDNNHPTLLGLSGSNDGLEWQTLGNFNLGNATSGAEVNSNAVSLGEGAYSRLRLSILATTGGNIFGHFAEIRLHKAEILGEDRRKDLGIIATNLYKLIIEGGATPDAKITEFMLQQLQEAYNTFMTEIERLNNGLLPSYMTQKSDLPTLFINTLDGSDISSKTVYQYANMIRLDGDSIARYDSLRIRGRGNSTWGMAKKPYRIKFASKEKFLGKGYAKAKDWTLMANYADKTLLRNATASFIGKELGQPFVPAAEFADVVLNGRFLGNYQISDQIEVRSKRVDIVEQEDPATEESDITGGYLIEFDGGAGSESLHYNTNYGTPITIKYPDDEIISKSQIDYIRNFTNDFEARIFSTDYTDPIKGYRAVTDSATLISWFLGTEYTGNVDGYYSVYAYKDQGDDHLYFGPMWDYDIAFDNCDRIGKVTERMIFDAGYSAGQMTNYVRTMFSDPWFYKAAGRAWHKAVKEDGLVERTLAFVDSMAIVIDQSQRENFNIWPLSQHVYNEITLFSTYQEGVDYLKDYLVKHAEYLCQQLPNPDGTDTDPEPEPDPETPLNPLDIAEGSLYYIYNVGVSMCTDVSEENMVCVWGNDLERHQSQMWQLIPAQGNYYRIVLPNSNLAITDIATLSNTQYELGSQLAVQPSEEGNMRQLWEFVPTAGYYSIANAQTGLAWNNSNGGADDGNAIISWTNNADNEWKPTRQWYIEEVADEILTDIASAGSEVDFRIAYDPIAQQVRLYLPLAAQDQSGTVFLHDLQGRLLGKGSASQPISVAHLPKATYVVSWNVQGRRRAVKMTTR